MLEPGIHRKAIELTVDVPNVRARDILHRTATHPHLKRQLDMFTAVIQNLRVVLTKLVEEGAVHRKQATGHDRRSNGPNRLVRPNHIPLEVCTNNDKRQPPIERAFVGRAPVPARDGQTVEVDRSEIRDDHAGAVLVDPSHEWLEPHGSHLGVAIQKHDDVVDRLLGPAVACPNNAIVHLAPHEANLVPGLHRGDPAEVLFEQLELWQRAVVVHEEQLAEHVGWGTVEHTNHISEQR